MKTQIPITEDGKLAKTIKTPARCLMCETENLIKTEVAGVPAWACMRCGSTFYRMKDQ